MSAAASPLCVDGPLHGFRLAILGHEGVLDINNNFQGKLWM
jgi:hypothetical protein